MSRKKYEATFLVNQQADSIPECLWRSYVLLAFWTHLMVYKSFSSSWHSPLRRASIQNNSALFSRVTSQYIQVTKGLDWHCSREIFMFAVFFLAHLSAEERFPLKGKLFLTSRQRGGRPECPRNVLKLGPIFAKCVWEGDEMGAPRETKL